MKLKKIKELFGGIFRKNEANEGKVDGEIAVFKFKGQDVKISREDKEGKINFIITLDNDPTRIGYIYYENNKYHIKRLDHSEKEYLEAAKKHLEENFEFLESPEHQTLAIRKKVEESIDPLFEFQIDGEKYFVEKIPANSYQNIDRIYFISDGTGRVFAKIKFQDAKLQPFNCPENLENTHILEESLKFLKAQQKNLNFPDIFLESGVKQ